MAGRPTDWSALGLDSDPTPGDQGQLEDALGLLQQMANDFQTISDTLKRVNGYAGEENFAGKWAEALRDKMNGRLTKFVDSAQAAFSVVANAVNAYHQDFLHQQQISLSLLQQAQASGLKPDDPQVKNWAAQATQAGTDLYNSEQIAAKAIQNAPGPVDPLSPWQEFLKALAILALVFIFPAIYFGGIFAVIEFGMSAILFGQALVDFMKGDLSVGGLILSLLGMLFPTFRALDVADVLDLLKGLGTFAKDGFVTIAANLRDFVDLMTADFSKIFSISSFEEFGAFAFRSGVWIFTGFKNLLAAAPKVFASIGPKVGELIHTGLAGLDTSFRTGSFFAVILPVSMREVETVGLLRALELGTLGDVLGMHIPTSAARNLALLNGLRFGELRGGDYAHAGFGNLPAAMAVKGGAMDFKQFDPAEVQLAGYRIDTTPSGVSVAAAKLSPGPITLDAHLEAPHLSAANLATGFTADRLGVGRISALGMPTLKFGGREFLDFRNPVEINNIAHGSSVLIKFDDTSVVSKTAMDDIHDPSGNPGGPHTTDLHVSATPLPGAPDAHPNPLGVPASSFHFIGPSQASTAQLRQLDIPGVTFAAQSEADRINTLHSADVHVGAPATTSGSASDFTTHLAEVTQLQASSFQELGHANVANLEMTHVSGLGVDPALRHLDGHFPGTTTTPELTALREGLGDTHHVAVSEQGIQVRGLTANDVGTIAHPDVTTPNAHAFEHLADTAAGASVAVVPHVTTDLSAVGRVHTAVPATTPEARLTSAATEIKALQDGSADVHVVVTERGIQARPVTTSDFGDHFGAPSHDAPDSTVHPVHTVHETDAASGHDLGHAAPNTGGDHTPAFSSSGEAHAQAGSAGKPSTVGLPSTRVPMPAAAAPPVATALRVTESRITTWDTIANASAAKLEGWKGKEQELIDKYDEQLRFESKLNDVRGLAHDVWAQVDAGHDVSAAELHTLRYGGHDLTEDGFTSMVVAEFTKLFGTPGHGWVPAFDHLSAFLPTLRALGGALDNGFAKVPVVVKALKDAQAALSAGPVGEREALLGMREAGVGPSWLALEPKLVEHFSALSEDKPLLDSEAFAKTLGEGFTKLVEAHVQLTEDKILADVRRDWLQGIFDARLQEVQTEAVHGTIPISHEGQARIFAWFDAAAAEHGIKPEPVSSTGDVPVLAELKQQLELQSALDNKLDAAYQEFRDEFQYRSVDTATVNVGLPGESAMLDNLAMRTWQGLRADPEYGELEAGFLRSTGVDLDAEFDNGLGQLLREQGLQAIDDLLGRTDLRPYNRLSPNETVSVANVQAYTHHEASVIDTKISEIKAEIAASPESSSADHLSPAAVPAGLDLNRIGVVGDELLHLMADAAVHSSVLKYLGGLAERGFASDLTREAVDTVKQTFTAKVMEELPPGRPGLHPIVSDGPGVRATIDELAEEHLSALITGESTFAKQIRPAFDQAVDHWHLDMDNGAPDVAAETRVFEALLQNLRSGRRDLLKYPDTAWQSAGGADAAWQKFVNSLIDSIPARLDIEHAALDALSDAGKSFVALRDAHPDVAATDRLGSAMRDEWLREFDIHWNPFSLDRYSWSADELARGDRFGSVLANAAAQAQAARAAAEAAAAKAEAAAVRAEARAAWSKMLPDRPLGADAEQLDLQTRLDHNLYLTHVEATADVRPWHGDTSPLPQRADQEFAAVHADTAKAINDTLATAMTRWAERGLVQSVSDAAAGAFASDVLHQLSQIHVEAKTPALRYGRAVMPEATADRWQPRLDELLANVDVWPLLVQAHAGTLLKLDAALAAKSADWIAASFHDWELEQLQKAAGELRSGVNDSFVKSMSYVAPNANLGYESFARWYYPRLGKMFDAHIARAAADVRLSPSLKSALADVKDAVLPDRPAGHVDVTVLTEGVDSEAVSRAVTGAVAALGGHEGYSPLRTLDDVHLDVNGYVNAKVGAAVDRYGQVLEQLGVPSDLSAKGVEAVPSRLTAKVEEALTELPGTALETFARIDQLADTHLEALIGQESDFGRIVGADFDAAAIRWGHANGHPADPDALAKARFEVTQDIRVGYQNIFGRGSDRFEDPAGREADWQAFFHGQIDTIQARISVAQANLPKTKPADVKPTDIKATDIKAADTKAADTKATDIGAAEVAPPTALSSADSPKAVPAQFSTTPADRPNLPDRLDLPELPELPEPRELREPAEPRDTAAMALQWPALRMPTLAEDLHGRLGTLAEIEALRPDVQAHLPRFVKNIAAGVSRSVDGFAALVNERFDEYWLQALRGASSGLPRASFDWLVSRWDREYEGLLHNLRYQYAVEQQLPVKLEQAAADFAAAKQNWADADPVVVDAVESGFLANVRSLTNNLYGRELLYTMTRDVDGDYALAYENLVTSLNTQFEKTSEYFTALKNAEEQFDESFTAFQTAHPALMAPPRNVTEDLRADYASAMAAHVVPELKGISTRPPAGLERDLELAFTFGTALGKLGETAAQTLRDLPEPGMASLSVLAPLFQEAHSVFAKVLANRKATVMDLTRQLDLLAGKLPGQIRFEASVAVAKETFAEWLGTAVAGMGDLHEHPAVVARITEGANAEFDAETAGIRAELSQLRFAEQKTAEKLAAIVATAENLVDSLPERLETDAGVAASVAAAGAVFAEVMAELGADEIATVFAGLLADDVRRLSAAAHLRSLPDDTGFDLATWLAHSTGPADPFTAGLGSEAFASGAPTAAANAGTMQVAVRMPAEVLAALDAGRPRGSLDHQIGAPATTDAPATTTRLDLTERLTPAVLTDLSAGIATNSREALQGVQTHAEALAAEVRPGVGGRLDQLSPVPPAGTRIVVNVADRAHLAAGLAIAGKAAATLNHKIVFTVADQSTIELCPPDVTR